MALLDPFPIQKADISFGAEYDYRLLDALLSEGVIGSGDLAVSQRAAGANMSVDVAAGTAVIDFDTPYGGKRLQRNTAASNSGTPGAAGADWSATFAAADGSLPRIDRVVLELKDSNVDASGLYRGRFKVVGGVATSGATLTNLNGAAAVPANSLLLANVLIDAAATSITDAKIDTTVRARALIGGAATLRGAELAYVAPAGGAGDITVTSTSEAAPTDLLVCPSFTLPAATDVWVEFYGVFEINTATANAQIAVYDNGSSQGLIHAVTLDGGIYTWAGKRKLTLAAGAHVIKVGGWTVFGIGGTPSEQFILQNPRGAFNTFPHLRVTRA
ncbi:MAG: hypothetical protein R3C15_15440 [Thermoleophilia bacterium]